MRHGVKKGFRTRVVRSSGNVFADLRVKNADEKQTRVRLAVAINRILQEKRLSQVAAAKLLEVNQPKVSALANYRLEGFSVERLLSFLNALGRDIEIRIERRRSRRSPIIHVTDVQPRRKLSYAKALGSVRGRRGSAWDFRPIEIRGEPLSKTILRGRGEQ
jgi:predicted XRE-type DNA-binding protein